MDNKKMDRSYLTNQVIHLISMIRKTLDKIEEADNATLTQSAMLSMVWDATFTAANHTHAIVLADVEGILEE